MSVRVFFADSELTRRYQQVLMGNCECGGEREQIPELTAASEYAKRAVAERQRAEKQEVSRDSSEATANHEAAEASRNPNNHRAFLDAAAAKKRQVAEVVLLPPA